MVDLLDYLWRLTEHLRRGRIVIVSGNVSPRRVAFLVVFADHRRVSRHIH